MIHNREEDIAFFTFLLEKGVDPNQSAPRGADVPGNFSRTPLKTTSELFLAACYNNSFFARTERPASFFAEPWIRHGADIDIKVNIDIKATTLRDVRTCLLTKLGHWPGFTPDECERRVDAWLADGRARRAALPPVDPSEPSNRPSLRAKLKKLLT